LKENDRVVVKVLSLEPAPVLILGSLPDTVTAKFYDLADSEDVGRLDVLVDKTVRVQGVDGRDQAGGELARVVQGKALLGEDVAKVSVDGLHDRVEKSPILELDLTELFELEDIRVIQGGDAAPAGEDLVFVEVRFDEADDARDAIAV
jgi:hypothetical protein